MPRVLILFAHPALEKSRVNRHLIRAVQDIPDVTFNDLYEAYPDFQIDVKHEQELLLEHDVVIMQHPFYWYSSPALLKEWMDLVLEHGFAYGQGGTSLKGKVLLSALTAGGPRDAYRPEGYNHFTLRHLLSPFEQTANLCGMRYLAPFVVHRSLSLGTVEDVEPYARAYRGLVESLVAGALDLEAAAGAERLNELIGAPTETAPITPAPVNGE
jgi:glutathione-regulated potassium-efflux system ancillary protein KefG